MRGTILQKGTGRPELVYGKPCLDRLLEHEVGVTEGELLLGNFSRTATAAKARPDGLLIRDGVPYAIEVDNQTMTAKQMRKKWELYAGFDGIILVVCRTKGRLRRLMNGATHVRNMTFFSLFGWLQSGVQRPWIDWRCRRSAACTPVRVGKGE